MILAREPNLFLCGSPTVPIPLRNHREMASCDGFVIFDGRFFAFELTGCLTTYQLVGLTVNLLRVGGFDWTLLPFFALL